MMSTSGGPWPGPLRFILELGGIPVDDWSSLDDEIPFEEGTPLQRDVLLKGWLLVVVQARDGFPRAGMEVRVRGCGFT